MKVGVLKERELYVHELEAHLGRKSVAPPLSTVPLSAVKGTIITEAYGLRRQATGCIIPRFRTCFQLAAGTDFQLLEPPSSLSGAWREASS